MPLSKSVALFTDVFYCLIKQEKPLDVQVAQNVRTTVI